MATKNHGGLIHRTLQAGGFYRAASVGEFADQSCGVIVPGCTAVVDERLRTITELRLPDRPVQIPHFKMTIKLGKSREDEIEWHEVPFTDYCPQGIGEGLQQAADTGVIVEISDDEMASLWPEVWAAREERIVFDPRDVQRGTAKPMLDLIEKAKQDRLADARAAHREADDAARNAAVAK